MTILIWHSLSNQNLLKKWMDYAFSMKFNTSLKNSSIWIAKVNCILCRAFTAKARRKTK